MTKPAVPPLDVPVSASQLTQAACMYESQIIITATADVEGAGSALGKAEEIGSGLRNWEKTPVLLL